MLYVVIHIHVAAMKSIRIPYYHSECHITLLKYRIGFRLSKISCKVIPVLYASFFGKQWPHLPLQKVQILLFNMQLNISVNLLYFLNVNLFQIPNSNAKSTAVKFKKQVKVRL